MRCTSISYWGARSTNILLRCSKESCKAIFARAERHLYLVLPGEEQRNICSPAYHPVNFWVQRTGIFVDTECPMVFPRCSAPEDLLGMAHPLLYSGALHLSFILGRLFYKYFAALQQGILLGNLRPRRAPFIFRYPGTAHRIIFRNGASPYYIPVRCTSVSYWGACSTNILLRCSKESCKAIFARAGDHVHFSFSDEAHWNNCSPLYPQCIFGCSAPEYL